MRPPILWTEVRLLVPTGWQELVAETLAEGNASAAFGRPSLAADEAPEGFEYVRLFLRDVEDTPQRRARIEALLAGLPEATGDEELSRVRLEYRALPHEDWANSWRKSWKPFRVLRLAVLPTWSSQRPRPDDVRLTLEPGGAFGSGRHPTTRTCLKVLQERPIAGARVLDAGSGSGVLSVAALVLGAERALGFDVDAHAQAYAESLAEDNDVLERAEFRTGGFECLRDDELGFDVVLANIYSDVVQQHARALERRLRPGGWFAFSGCPRAHEAPTRDAILAAGLALEETRARGRWLTFVGTRP